MQLGLGMPSDRLYRHSNGCYGVSHSNQLVTYLESQYLDRSFSCTLLRSAVPTSVLTFRWGEGSFGAPDEVTVHFENAGSKY